MFQSHLNRPVVATAVMKIRSKNPDIVSFHCVEQSQDKKACGQSVYSISIFMTICGADEFIGCSNPLKMPYGNIYCIFDVGNEEIR